MTSVEEQLNEINSKLESLFKVVQHFPVIGFASNIDNTTKKLKRSATKEDIRAQLIKQWNKEHPLYPVKY
jgi:hypothetical protein